ncbi:MAG: imidazole glycerol phosphate synthase, glutamine amidotransferase subunit [Deltaproteobacteria bacterium RBG_16_71_12]|nr:MAG: imidazole glycerol phosphate synthase, glutamine amidotransferase subunit [Deltaproteobacteria bacterium RBG_16_71_12]
MPTATKPRAGDRVSKRVAIVDFGLGNLFSVQQACAAVGLEAVITPRADDVQRADAVVLPGVGAFADAMRALREARVDLALRAASDSGKLVIGICLGMQLLFSSSDEFGSNEGLGIVPGVVRRLPQGKTGAHERRSKVPEVGWNAIRRASDWQSTPLEGVEDDAQLYFVHSYYGVPVDDGAVLSTTTYGGTTYCSSVRQGRTYGFQFHPERSGPTGLKLYENIRRQLG